MHINRYDCFVHLLYVRFHESDLPWLTYTVTKAPFFIRSRVYGHSASPLYTMGSVGIELGVAQSPLYPLLFSRQRQYSNNTDANRL